MAIVKRSCRTEDKPEKVKVNKRTRKQCIEDEGFVPEPGKKIDPKTYDKTFKDDKEIPEHWASAEDILLTARSPAASIEVWNRLAEKNRVNLKKKVFQDVTYGMVQEAIFESGGFETNVARRLNLSTYYVRQIFAKHKTLFQLFNEIRDSVTDEVEMYMLDKIRSGAKESVNLIIFYLKCLGKSRGYVEMDHSGPKKSSVRMKIVPTSEKKKKAAEKIASEATGKVVTFKKAENS